MNKEASIEYCDSFEMLQFRMKLLHDNDRKITAVFPYEDGWCIVYEGSKFWWA